MENTKRRAAVKILILGPYLILLYILQSTVFTHIELFGAKPMLLPIAAAGMALFGGRIQGGVFGLFAGMLTDLSCNQPTVEFTLILTFSGLLIGVLSDTALVQGFPSFLLTAAAELAVCSAFQVVIPVVLRNAPPAVLAGIALRQCGSSLVFAIPFYYISRFLSRVISR